MSLLWSLIGFVIGAGALVTLHELGHFLAARALGIGVVSFSIGFGPEIYSSRAGAARVRYTLRLLPLGGSVTMLDERAGRASFKELPRTFGGSHPLKRVATLLAGPAASFLVAILLLAVLIGCWGRQELKPIVAEVAADSPAARAGLTPGELIRRVDEVAVADRAAAISRIRAALAAHGRVALETVRSGKAHTVALAAPAASTRKRGGPLKAVGFDLVALHLSTVIARVAPGGPAARAGIKAGDRILTVEGTPVSGPEVLAVRMRRVSKKAVEVNVRRGAKTLTLPVTVSRTDHAGLPLGALGVLFAPTPLPDGAYHLVRYSPLAALREGAREAATLAMLEARTGWRLVTLRGNLQALVDLAGDREVEQERRGAAGLVLFLAEISLSLALVNLLPIPGLDGGQIVFELSQGLRRKVRRAGAAR